tara:strand:- start:7651 stop:9438 length:1788 start_codon:yes stop_codon:yes gene_type:complete
MLRDIRKNKFFNRRALIIGSIQAFMAGALISRLAYLQLFKNKEYTIQSDSNRIKTMMMPAPRGNIYDRNNMLLTQNNDSYRLLFYNDKKRNVEQISKDLFDILDLQDQQKARILRKFSQIGNKSVISLIDNLGWYEMARIESNSHKLPSISIESGTIRQYKYPFSLAHILGYVSLPSQKEVEQSKQALYMHPDFRLGKLGIEKLHDEYLRGKYGLKYVEVNSKDIPIKTIKQDLPQQGQDVNLTIDINLQNYVHDLIKDLVASVIVLDVTNGEILSCNSTPTFNTNNFVEGVSYDYWQAISNNNLNPLNNRPISAIYPPGSTFKIIVALAALESGYNFKKKHICRGHNKYGNRIFNCWKEEGHGALNLSDAIKNSCNIYFYEIANEIGYDAIYNMAKKFGYGVKTGVDLIGEISPILPNEEWKRAKFKSKWVGGDTLNASIGQGYILATPMQIAIANSAIANGGRLFRPYFVKKRLSAFYGRFVDIKEQHIDFVKKAMYKVVNEKGGTAYYQRLKDKDFKVSGKTGTSQVISKRGNDKLEDKFQNHAIFTGFAPSHNPKYSISVIVENGGGGSSVAAPIAMKVMNFINLYIYNKS